MILCLASRPILMAPKFGLEDGSHSNFDATLVLATMLISQLHEGAASEPPVGATGTHPHTEERNASHMLQENCRANVSFEPPSDHTRIWSDLSGNFNIELDDFLLIEILISLFILKQVHLKALVLWKNDRHKEKQF